MFKNIVSCEGCSRLISRRWKCADWVILLIHHLLAGWKDRFENWECRVRIDPIYPEQFGFLSEEPLFNLRKLADNHNLVSRKQSETKEGGKVRLGRVAWEWKWMPEFPKCDRKVKEINPREPSGTPLRTGPTVIWSYLTLLTDYDLRSYVGFLLNPEAKSFLLCIIRLHLILQTR